MPRSIIPIIPDTFDYGLCPPKNRYALDQVPLEFADAKQSHNDVGAGECFIRGSKVLGKYFAQQQKVYNMYRYRRDNGQPCDSMWFKIEMKRICEKDKPEGYDPKVDKFTNKWKAQFIKRWKISVQKKTNNKSKSILERIHKVKNCH